MIPTDFHSYFSEGWVYHQPDKIYKTAAVGFFLSVNHPTLEGTQFFILQPKRSDIWNRFGMCEKEYVPCVIDQKYVCWYHRPSRGGSKFPIHTPSTYINHQQVGVSLWIGWKGLISWEKKIFISYRCFLKPIHWVSKNSTPPFHLVIWFQPGSFGTHRGPRGCHAAGMGMDS